MKTSVVSKIHLLDLTPFQLLTLKAAMEVAFDDMDASDRWVGTEDPYKKQEFVELEAKLEEAAVACGLKG